MATLRDWPYDEDSILRAQPTRAASSPAAPRPILVSLAPNPFVRHLDAIILAWLPGALKPHPALPFCSKTQELFERERQLRLDAGQDPFPQELGQAASEISRLESFSKLSSVSSWNFGKTRSALSWFAQANDLIHPSQPLSLAHLREAVEPWARQRLQSFLVFEKPSFYHQMQDDPASVESRLAAALKAQHEALLLERATPKPSKQRHRSL